MSKKRRVKNTTKQKQGITNTMKPTVSSSTLTFDFTYNNWLKSIKSKEFTNKLSGESEFGRFIFEILHKIMPNIQKSWEQIKLNKKTPYRHCHTIAKDKLETVEEIITEIHGKSLLDYGHDETLKYWQLGISQSIRIVAVYDQNKNIMYPLFVDYHHLLHEDIKYNQRDYDNYEFCPYCVYGKKYIS